MARPPAYWSKPVLPPDGWNGTVMISAGTISATSNRNEDRAVAWNRPHHAATAIGTSATAAAIR